MAKRTKKITPEPETTPAETPKATGRKKAAAAVDKGDTTTSRDQSSAENLKPKKGRTKNVPGAPEMSGAGELTEVGDRAVLDALAEINDTAGTSRGAGAGGSEHPGEFGDAPVGNTSVHPDYCTRFTDFDIHLFREGRHYKLYDKLGAHVMTYNGAQGTYFAVWAPNAEQVSVIGSFNHWMPGEYQLNARHDHSGIWENFFPNLGHGTLYKYHIASHNGFKVAKADPFGFLTEEPPRTASVVWDLQYEWNDKKWLDRRKKCSESPQPYSVYEMHIGSWRRVPEEEYRSLTYREMARELPDYLKEMGFTHVEFMPVMEHPFYGSWGYQVTGYFATSSRYGTPQDFMYLVDALHEAGIGVILDWVPSHFPSDEHGLVYFDGTHLYEHEDVRKGFHPDWKSYIFNYGRNEVKSFLISNALFWIDKYHADGLRVDAVASMLYLDYSRKHDEWIPNEYGGRENLEAIAFIREFNDAVHQAFPDALTIAEESTAWPMVSKPASAGGLGFDMKWMMGWMHDTLSYFQMEPVYRSHHQGQITFSIIYAFTENFMLPLSHDEVVYGKGSLIRKMPGDDWQKFANLRLLYGYMYAHPGAKLLFMGAEFGQPSEWAHEGSLEWHLTQQPMHSGVMELMKRLAFLVETSRFPGRKCYPFWPEK